MTAAWTAVAVGVAMFVAGGIAIYRGRALRRGTAMLLPMVRQPMQIQILSGVRS